MSLFPDPVQDLIDELNRLPGIGPKSALRIAFYLLQIPKDYSRRLAETIVQTTTQVGLCKVCFNVAIGELCPTCQNPSRDRTVICVVQEPKDVISIEKTGTYKGTYHVLQGVISPMEGMGPDQIRIKELQERVERAETTEVIVATSSNMEGEATAMYIARMLKPSGITVSRIASGLPVGGDLEYADELTLSKALAGRRALE